jgi:hypothetical protein
MPIFEEIVYEKHGAKIPETRGFLIETDTNLPWSKLEACFHETYKRWQDIPIFDGVSEFLRELYWKGDNDPIRIITARPSHQCANDTYKLCERLGVPFELIMTGNPNSMRPGQPDVDKFDYLHRYRFFVDDRRKTAIELSQKGKFIYMPKMPYNKLDKKYENIKEINSVADLYQKIYWFAVEV